MEHRWGLTVGLALAITVSAAGCAQVLPGTGRETVSIDELPGIHETNFSKAQFTYNATDCREVHILVDANRSAVAGAVQPFSLARTEANTTELAITLTRCQRLATPNVTTHDATLVEVSTPIDRAERATVRDDALIAVATTAPPLADRLETAGFPVEELDRLVRESRRNYRIAEQATVNVATKAYPFETTFTAVSIETELPFGTAASIGRDRWVIDGNRSLEMRTGLNITELGGVSATLETRPGSRMAELWGNTTRTGHGFQARYDVHAGLMPVEE